MIRIHIIEDHPIIVDGIRQRLRHHGDQLVVTGTSVSVKEFLASDHRVRFDLIILDLWIPDTDPLDNLLTLKRAFPRKKIVIFTQETGGYWVRTMMENGAAAYIQKNSDSRLFKETLEQVYRGRTVAPDISDPYSLPENPLPLVQPDYILKPSERVILVRLAAGASLKTIATERVSTVSAIEKTLKKIRQVYGVSTNPELIRVLVGHRIL